MIGDAVLLREFGNQGVGVRSRGLGCRRQWLIHRFVGHGGERKVQGRRVGMTDLREEEGDGDEEGRGRIWGIGIDTFNQS